MQQSTQSYDQEMVTKEFFANPYPLFQRMREQDPVYWSDYFGFWILTRYEDVFNLTRNHSVFSSARRFHAMFDTLPEDVRKGLDLLYLHYSTGIIFSDPPNHTRIRGLVSRAFSARYIESMRPHVQSIVDDLLDAVQGKDGMEVIADLAYPLPARLICEIMGLPLEDRPKFRKWSDDIIALQSTGRADAAKTEQGQRSLRDLRNYFADQVADRRRHPGADVLSILVQANEQGDRLSEPELVSTSVTLLTAGQETTTSMISSGLLWLLRNPAQLQKLRENPSLVDSAVEEMLRYEPPVARQHRITMEDIEIGGKSIKKGQIVSGMTGAANRDPNQFPDPDRFDITRRDNRHLSFGHGIHFCLGGPLARIEGQVTFNTLLRRFPHIELATSQPQWRQDLTLRRLVALPVRFTKA